MLAKLFQLAPTWFRLVFVGDDVLAVAVTLLLEFVSGFVLTDGRCCVPSSCCCCCSGCCCFRTSDARLDDFVSTFVLISRHKCQLEFVKCEYLYFDYISHGMQFNSIPIVRAAIGLMSNKVVFAIAKIGHGQSRNDFDVNQFDLFCAQSSNVFDYG